MSENQDSGAPRTLARAGRLMQKVGRAVAIAGVVAPLLLIGGLKFTTIEIEALRPLIGGAPWLAWLYPTLGEAGASYFLGMFELCAAALLLVSSWSHRAAILGGLLAASTFVVTCSLLLTAMAWEPRLGGFPALSGLGQFLIKDVALLGIAIFVAGDGLARSTHRQVMTGAAP